MHVIVESHSLSETRGSAFTFCAGRSDAVLAAPVEKRAMPPIKRFLGLLALFCLTAHATPKNDFELEESEPLDSQQARYKIPKVGFHALVVYQYTIFFPPKFLMMIECRQCPACVCIKYGTITENRQQPLRYQLENLCRLLMGKYFKFDLAYNCGRCVSGQALLLTLDSSEMQIDC